VIETMLLPPKLDRWNLGDLRLVAIFWVCVN